MLVLRHPSLTLHVIRARWVIDRQDGTTFIRVLTPPHTPPVLALLPRARHWRRPDPAVLCVFLCSCALVLWCSVLWRCSRYRSPALVNGGACGGAGATALMIASSSDCAFMFGPASLQVCKSAGLQGCRLESLQCKMQRASHGGTAIGQPAPGANQPCALSTATLPRRSAAGARLKNSNAHTDLAWV